MRNLKQIGDWYDNQSENQSENQNQTRIGRKKNRNINQAYGSPYRKYSNSINKSHKYQHPSLRGAFRNNSMPYLLALNFANFIFNFARMLSGAIFIIILEEQGISLSTISFAKGSQLLISMVLSLPCGIFADKYGGKYAVIMASIFSSFYYYLLINATPYKVIIGEIFNGIALAFYIGAFEAWIFSLTPQKDALNLHTRLAKARELSYLGIVFGGLLGTYTTRYVFHYSLIFMIMSIALFLFVPMGKMSKSNANPEKTKYLLPALRELFFKKICIFFLISSFLIGGCMQLIYQFWQPFFLKFSELRESSQFFGYIFISFMLTQYVSSKFIRTYILKNTGQIIFFTGIFWALSAVFLTNTMLTTNLYVAIVSFCIFFGMITVASNLLTSLLGEIFELDLQSTVISILDLLGKSLGSCFLFLGKGVIPLEKYNFGWPLLILVFCPLSIWAIFQRKKLWIPQINLH